MQAPKDLTFDHVDRRRIYQYVESRGAVDLEEVRDALGIDPRGFRHHVTFLKRDGLIEADGDELRVAFGGGELEEHTTRELAFTIRMARPEDRNGLIEAIRAVAAAGTYIEADTVAHLIDHEEVLLRYNQLEARVFFVATVEEAVVGWVHLDAAELDELAHTAELTVGVLEECRGHGIGGRLLERGLRWAAANDYEKIYQAVPATNETAIEFLESHGWETEAVRADHYKIDGEYVDEVMMAVSLPR
ncbi:MAG: GNAT family N-acetyltransferase [Halobacteriales archaeon]